MKPLRFAVLFVLMLTLSSTVQAPTVFATGSPTLAPNPVPSACSARCKAIVISGPTLGFAITFSQNDSVTGKYEVLLGPTPDNVTLLASGGCGAAISDQTVITTSFSPMVPLRDIGYVYCLYYTTLPAATSYSLRIAFKHPGSLQFDQTISWAIP